MNYLLSHIYHWDQLLRTLNDSLLNHSSLSYPDLLQLLWVEFNVCFFPFLSCTFFGYIFVSDMVLWIQFFLFFIFYLLEKRQMDLYFHLYLADSLISHVPQGTLVHNTCIYLPFIKKIIIINENFYWWINDH